jgi:hypothetical protein
MLGLILNNQLASNHRNLIRFGRSIASRSAGPVKDTFESDDFVVVAEL